MSKVEGKTSELEGSKTSFTAFTVYILYYLLICKNIFPSSLVQGSGSPRDFLGFQFYSHSIIPVPRLAGGSPLCKIPGKNQE